MIAFAQPHLISAKRQKKADVMEIQVNGGKIHQKVLKPSRMGPIPHFGDAKLHLFFVLFSQVNYGMKLLESTIPVSAVFEESELVDCIAVTRGHGFQGVIQRWGVTRLPRKTHKGLRKVLN